MSPSIISVVASAKFFRLQSCQLKFGASSLSGRAATGGLANGKFWVERICSSELEVGTAVGVIGRVARCRRARDGKIDAIPTMWVEICVAVQCSNRFLQRLDESRLRLSQLNEQGGRVLSCAAESAQI